MTCRHFGVCGGCGLPGIAYSEQLRSKRQKLSSWFGGVDVPPVIPSPLEQGFRQKVAFVFGEGPRGAGLVMGHYAAGSRRIVPIEECPVHGERGNALAFALRDELARARIPPGILRHVVIRTTADGREAAVMLVVAANHRSLRAPIGRFLDRPGTTGFFVNINDRPGPFMIGRETLRITGRSHVREDVLGTSFLVSPTAFFQANVAAAGELLQLVLGRAAGAKRLIDLYSGAGLFAIPLARAGSTVIAVEENRDAVADAERNLALNRVPPGAVRLIASRVEDAMPRLRSHRADVVVLDPPRQGCPDRVIESVFHTLRPRRAIYVSCNPERLAVERRQIERGGYRLASLAGVDMFPHTEHIEAVATFDIS